MTDCNARNTFTPCPPRDGSENETRWYTLRMQIARKHQEIDALEREMREIANKGMRHV